MNWDQISGKWDQMKGEVKNQWAKLTDDDLMFVKGQKDKLVGKIQERYGMLEDKARKEVEEWVNRANARLDKMGEKLAERRDSPSERRDSQG